MISPLLANLYLHWFDKVFHAPGGPAHWAKAKLVRYADDFVVLARYQSPQLSTFIEKKLEAWMGLEINREKTRVVHLQEEGSEPGLPRVHVPLRPRPPRTRHRYLNVHPAKKSVARMREALREQTSKKQCFKPLPPLIEEPNRQLIGWANYFRFGYPREAFREINTYTRQRLTPRAPPQPTALPTAGRGDLLSSTSSVWAWCICEAQPLNCLRMPDGDSHGESRMREICMSGSTRGE